MRTTTIRAGLLTLGLAAASLLSVADVQAQATAKRAPGATSNSTRTRGGSADANVRRDDAPNALNKPATTEPAGKSTRGGSASEPGQLCVDSRVDLYVKIYIDGQYVGTVSPWGDSCGYYGGGDHTIYARAVFTDGSYSSWGPVTGNTGPGFRWTIRN
jgi:hypothetical protein